MNSRIDYLTLTIKSDLKTFAQAEEVLMKELFLKGLYLKMTNYGRTHFYANRFSYENIDILFPAPDKFKTQGICIQFSSKGLDYFINYLASLRVDFQAWCRKFRALALDGYITKCTRFDYAIDDISFVGGESPKLSIRKLFNSVSNNELRSRTSIVDFYGERQRVKKVKGDYVVGRTLYIGSRASKRVIRFYDKKAEQTQKGEAVPDNVNTWIRCEIEYHDSYAMQIFNAFCDYDVPDFCRFMATNLNSHITFINRDNDNISRCSVKRWWREFLDCVTDCFRFPVRKPARSALARALRGVSQYTRVINSIVSELGWEEFQKFINGRVKIMKQSNKETINQDIVFNIRENNMEYEKLNGVSAYQYNSFLDCDDFNERLNFHKNSYLRYHSQRSEAGASMLGSFLHTAVLDGQEVLLDGV